VTGTDSSAAPDYNAAPVYQARGLVKRYGRVTALDGADFELYPGEILAIVGDNGAGKSTLIKILSGVVTPDAGELWLDGHRVHPRNPLHARELGIETVYQDLALAPGLDITSNLFLGREERVAGLLGSVFRKLNKRSMQRQAATHMSSLKIGIRSMAQAVETLSGGQRQGVAIARAVSWGRRIVIMDEPTAALGVQESGMVLELIRTVRARGIPVVVISHSLPQVFAVADRIQVMRLGRRVGVGFPTRDTMDGIVAMITGARASEAEWRPAEAASSAE
jgi:fructose transport system ATP-binding protein